MTCAASEALARTWIVDRQGGGDFTTIQPAVNAASSGDTILLHAGRYLEYAPYDAGALTEDTYVVLEKPDLTLRGVDRDSVIIGPETYEWTTTNEPNGFFVAASATGCVLESLTIENIPAASEQDAAATMRDVRVVGTYYGIASYSLEPVLFERLELENCSSHCIGIWRRAQNSVIRDSEIRGYVTGILASSVQNLVVENCRFADGAVIKFQTGGSGTVQRCAFAPGAVVVGNGPEVEVIDCLFDPNPDTNVQVISASARITQSKLAKSAVENIAIHSTSDVLVNQNDLLNSYEWQGPPTIWVRDDTAPFGMTVNFEQNWWGTADVEQISNWIIDATDQPSRNIIVDFEPFLTQSIPTRKQSLSELKRRFGEQDR
jgi:hypothetical protein